MYKYLFLTVMLLMTYPFLWARQIRGKVLCQKQPLAGIVVTDGTSFAQTNHRGVFKLEVSAQSDFVYLFTPSGYSASFEEGTPQFYKSLSNNVSSYNFDLRKLSFDADHYALLAMADPQTKTMEQFDRFERESVTDLKATIAEYEAQKINPIGIALGDIAWDELELFNNYKQAISGLKIPFYPVIGNHDHDLNETNDYASAETYRQQFGPTYYGFNLGKQHYIVLDDIVYKGNKSYDEDLTDQQLEWVRSYLAFVPKGSELVIAMHAPFKNIWNDKLIPRGNELLDICKDYKVSFISGHTHLNSNEAVAPGIIEHNIGAICGTWWTAETCRDGTPNGYQVFEGTPDGFSWYYKSVGKSKNYQMVLFDKGRLANQPNAVVAKIWNWDSQWKVQWFEDGKPMGAMKQVSAYDPDYLHYLQHNAKDKNAVPEYKKSVQSFFYFAANPSLNAKKVKVIATDRFGNIYEQAIELNPVDVVAHRGGAGLMPENTIEAMINALLLGVNTLELDLNITKDGQVIVAHDAHINPAFTTNSDGSEISEEEAKDLCFCHLTYEDVLAFDTGNKSYERFPNQQKQSTRIPLLSALIDSIELVVARHHMSPVNYNIEIKSDRALEERGAVPHFRAFTDRAMALLLNKNLGDRLLVQSFDTRTLNYLHKKYPNTRLAFLVGNINGFKNNMNELDFVPEVYSPFHKLVNTAFMDSCRQAGMRVIPWTVDDDEDLREMLRLKVDGIITNYPDRVLEYTRGYFGDIDHREEDKKVVDYVVPSR